MDRAVTDVIHPVACGLDVHLAVVVACLARSGPKGGPGYDERSFPTTQRGLRELKEWLRAAGCEAVGMEARTPTPKSRQRTIQRHLKELQKLGLEVQLTEF